MSIINSVKKLRIFILVKTNKVIKKTKKNPKKKHIYDNFM